MKMPDTSESSIIESGSNENGSYIKFSDGTMICYTDVIRCSANNPYVEVTFPKSFKIEPTIVLTNRFANTQAVLWSVGNPKSHTFRAYTYRIDNNTYEAVASYIAIGRWK